MTLTEFDNGYWYATELKTFAQTIRLPSAGKLRKDELEKAIRLFLKTGEIKNPAKRNLSMSGIKDIQRGLRLDLPVVVYTNDKETKDFLEREAQKLAPGLKRKSGVRYRLNRWREERLFKGVKLTYGDLVKEYIRLNQTRKPFAQIPHGRYINFMSDFFTAEKVSTKEKAEKYCSKLITLDGPTNYRTGLQSKSHIIIQQSHG